MRKNIAICLVLTSISLIGMSSGFLATAFAELTFPSQQPPPGGWNPNAECNDPDSRYTCNPDCVTCDRQTGLCVKMSSC